MIRQSFPLAKYCTYGIRQSFPRQNASYLNSPKFFPPEFCAIRYLVIHRIILKSNSAKIVNQSQLFFVVMALTGVLVFLFYDP